MKILGVPYGKGGLGKGDGSISGPAQIVKHLDKKHVYEELQLDKNLITKAHEEIEQAIINLDEKAIILGGDHSITYSAVKGFSKKNMDSLFIIFDAHPDLMEDFIPPTHEAYLRALIDEGVIEAEQVIIIGVRNSDKQEDDYISEKKIKSYTMKEILERGVQKIVSEILERINKPVYLSLDIDVVDPSEAPGTGYKEPNGMGVKDFMYCLEELKKTGKLAMVDLVEVQPALDVEEKTVKLAAKCVDLLSNY